MQLCRLSPHAGYVRHGSLSVARRIDGDYVAAKAYLSRDPVEAALFARLERAPARHYRLEGDARALDYFNAASDVIVWDPHSALRTTGGGRQSPALGLGHEVDHAVAPRSLSRKLAGSPSRRYDDDEERRVITGSERHAAKVLGEGVRYDHRGDPYRVRSVTALTA